ncbi:Hypothetical_protein [Hexamita inflata]|uniref:Hypothetical_protein n=1 Tax=Hexamita inflata TaxID=28002 RepID=A0AA86V8H9_9EUKA|nr:Hypothetical protein HINF_LOCUS46953 [Hexamita inflata]
MKYQGIEKRKARKRPTGVQGLSLLILYYIDYYISEDGTVITSVTFILLNLINILIADAFIESGSLLMHKSLDLKQYNQSKVYLAYNFIIGYIFTILISLGLLLGLQNKFAVQMMDNQFTQQQQVFYQWLVIIFSCFYFLISFRKILKVEGLFAQNFAMGFTFVIEQFYILTMQIFITQMLNIEIILYSFVFALVGPLIINGIIQFCCIFRIFQGKIKYSTTHFIEKQLLKPFRPKIAGDIMKHACYYILLNSGDALIYFFTYTIIKQSEEYTIVAFSILYTELTNCLNKAIIYTMNSAFRINMQLKRYDRVYEFFVSSFIFFFINLAFQIITFAIRNIVYKAFFCGEFDDSFQFFHSCIDGLLGTFNAYTMAVIRSDSNMKVGIVVGTFKLLLSISFWLVGKFTNNGNSHYSTMVYFYKYCVDITSNKKQGLDFSYQHFQSLLSQESLMFKKIKILIQIQNFLQH